MINEKFAKHPRIQTVGTEGEVKLPENEKVSDALKEKRHKRENIPFYPHSIHFNTQASRDGILHFVNGIGDTNPLFTDEQYAKKSKYGNIIAPGTYLYTVQWDIMAGIMAGIHGWYVGGDWEWYRPIYAGDEFKCVDIIRELVEKKGRKTGGGSTYYSYGEKLYVNQRNELVGKERLHTAMAERSAAGEAKKDAGIPKPVYTQQEWNDFLEMYENEEVRGNKPRYWEDVNVGDKLGPMLKGPLTVRDMLGWLMGAGSPFFKAHKIEYDYEGRHPKVLEYVKSLGEADVPELVHIFDEYAKTIGIERAYDYGSQRMTWYGQLFTNWMGDDGFLYKLSGDLRAFNLVGDVTFFEGKVVNKYILGNSYCVDVEAWAKNQRGESSIPPHMNTVLLPSREKGPVVYPNPSAELLQMVEKARPLDELIKAGIL
jgi:acyl dehydratase